MKLPVFRIWLLAISTCLSVRAQPTGELLIDVRSGIDQAENAKREQDPAYAGTANQRQRLFLLAHVSEETNWREKLIKPVDANQLAREVTRQLEQQGFRAVGPNQKPEIIVTVKYGRGQLMSNPYLDLDNLNIGDPRRVGQHSNLSDSDRVGPQSHVRYTGLEAKAQAASVEKLIIQVRAWAYPPPANPKEKEHLLWMTTMNVDDPDHVDLNVVAAKMLAVGAPFFDKPIARERDPVLSSPLPDGHVNVGTPEVVKPQQK